MSVEETVIGNFGENLEDPSNPTVESESTVAPESEFAFTVEESTFTVAPEPQLQPYHLSTRTWMMGEPCQPEDITFDVFNLISRLKTLSFNQEGSAPQYIMTVRSVLRVLSEQHAITFSGTDLTEAFLRGLAPDRASYDLKKFYDRYSRMLPGSLQSRPRDYNSLCLALQPFCSQYPVNITHNLSSPGPWMHASGDEHIEALVTSIVSSEENASAMSTSAHVSSVSEDLHYDDSDDNADTVVMFPLTNVGITFTAVRVKTWYGWMYLTVALDGCATGSVISEAMLIAFRKAGVVIAEGRLAEKLSGTDSELNPGSVNYIRGWAVIRFQFVSGDSVDILFRGKVY